MQDLQQRRILAHEIGLCRIALVVDQLQSRLQSHPTLAEPFGVIGNWGDHRARLTYFWWVTLGGKNLRGVRCDVVSRLERADVDCEVLKDWMKLFHQVAVPILGEELTRRWMTKAEAVDRRLLKANDNCLDELAKAS